MHAYRSPNAASGARASAAKAAKPAKVEESWSSSMRRAQGDAVPYSKSGSYAVGSRVAHPSFGEGVVTRLSSPTVCEVLFATGTIKLLMRPGERPS
jgi:hypothetical protein